MEPFALSMSESDRHSLRPSRIHSFPLRRVPPFGRQEPPLQPLLFTEIFGEDEDDNSSEFFEVCYLNRIPYLSLFFFFPYIFLDFMGFCG